jgi:hypothetical protein
LSTWIGELNVATCTPFTTDEDFVEKSSKFVEKAEA